eukprot:gene3404-13448_t
MAGAVSSSEQAAVEGDNAAGKESATTSATAPEASASSGPPQSSFFNSIFGWTPAVTTDKTDKGLEVEEEAEGTVAKEVPVASGAQEFQRSKSTLTLTNLKPKDLVRGLLQDLSETVGVIHLALHSVHVDAGMVVQWKQQLSAVVEPGPEASKLVSEFGYNPSKTSLGAIFSQSDCCQSRDDLVVRLGKQELTTPSGTPVSSFLFSRTSPARLLTPDDVLAMMTDWNNQIVVTSALLSQAMIEGLLKCGVKAVVAPTTSLMRLDEPQVLAAFRTFYHVLFDGEAILTAIETAEQMHPEIQGKICCFHM